ncbi:MAG: protoporphyrinogen/coproporphyrinogen oxidase [Frankiaceae bacterium]|nr:protoporphyrinogen/coproporphyrinogen oxidase [Frankiaceae bacterium]
MASVAVVGAGVAGLAAAHRLRTMGYDVIVLEAGARIGGKLLTTEFAGIRFDEGAESIATRDPAVPALLTELGLADQVVDPATTKAGLVVGGTVRPLPPGTVLGVPTSARSLTATLGRRVAWRASLDHVLPRRVGAGDVAVGRLVARRLGRAVADGLVDPLLGGVYAGRADQLSLAATVPALAAQVARTRSVLSAAAASRLPGAGGPRLQALASGMASLPAALAEGVEVRLSATVREIHTNGDGWRLVTGPVPAPVEIDVDAVVLAAPAAPTSRLLSGIAPRAAELLAGVGYASMAVVSLVFSRAAVRPPAGSGFLIPAREGHSVKAVTLSTAKWAHIAEAAPDAFLLRCSIGRFGDTDELQRTDDDLVQASLRTLAAVAGIRADPSAARVSRWGGGLPQYAVGHLERVAAVTSALAELPTVAVCGAAYGGVGIAACLTGGMAAADRVAAGLAARAR